MRYLVIAAAALFAGVTAGSAAAVELVVNQQHPEADDANPGTARSPLKSISAAAQRAQPGDRVVIYGGVYRESVTLPRGGTPSQPIAFTAAPAANVVVTGADRLTEWRREEGPDRIYSTPWPHRFITWSETGTHPADDYHAIIGRAEQVHVDNYPLLQVLERAKLSRGTFWVDAEHQRLYVWSRDNRDISTLRVDASVREVLWRSKEHVRLRGIRFRYAANQAQTGAAQFAAHNVVEDCVFERTNSMGAAFTGEGIVVRRCTFEANGMDAFTAVRAHRLRMTDCVIRNNNTKGFNRGWGAGNKLALCRGVVIEQCVFEANRSVGLWFDIGNEECVVRNNLFANNEDAGLFYEISYGLRAHDNVFVGNGLADTHGAWGANGAIALSSSPGCVIERNLMVGNREGFQFREQLRTTPRIDDEERVEAVWNHDTVVHNNVIAFNERAQTAGWFATEDGRHWPRAMQKSRPEASGRPADNIAADYVAKDSGGQPVGLSLEALALTLTGNLYDTHPGQPLFQWGCLWDDDHRVFHSLAPVVAELGLEKGSRVGGVSFRDPLTRDFRVPRDSLILKMGCYPRGSVPGVRLGIAR